MLMDDGVDSGATGKEIRKATEAKEQHSSSDGAEGRRQQ
jgi:hypothetical protein